MQIRRKRVSEGIGRISRIMNQKTGNQLGGINTKFRKISTKSLYSVNWAFTRDSQRMPRSFWRIPCGGCRGYVTRAEALKGELVFAVSKVWHRNHFCCVQCYTTLLKPAHRDFCDSLDGPVCTDCFMDKEHPKCEGCGKALQEVATEAFGKQWHKECIRCEKCHEPLMESRYVLLDGKPYDEDCYFLTKFESMFKESKEKKNRNIDGK